MNGNVATLGVDIGGTKIAAAVVTSDGDMVGFNQRHTPAAGGSEAVVEEALKVARAALAQFVDATVVGCGIGTAGTVDADGVITHATSALPGWAGTDLRAVFHQALGIPVVVLNDVHAMAIGEGRYGAAVGMADALVVAVGTGIGGGILHDGRLVLGASGSAGSIGHVPVSVPGRRRCPCGGWNHLEAYAAGPAIEARYAEVTDLSLRLPAIAAQARAGDLVACALIKEAAELLGRALGGAANLLDPDVIVIAGGVAALEDLITEPVLHGLADEALPAPGHARVSFTALDAAAVVGAASVARDSATHPREAR